MARMRDIHSGKRLGGPVPLGGLVQSHDETKDQERGRMAPVDDGTHLFYQHLVSRNLRSMDGSRKSSSL